MNIDLNFLGLNNDSKIINAVKTAILWLANMNIRLKNTFDLFTQAW